IGRMEPGTLFMNGPNVPHGLQPAEPEEKDWENPALAVLHFSPASLGQQLLERDEMTAIRQLLTDAARGFEFHGETRERAAEQILAMRDQDELERFASFLMVLRTLANSSERSPLASAGYRPSLRQSQIDRVDRVVRFLQEHKTEPLTLEQVASVASLTPQAFCRFFKASVGKTFVRYLNDLRIGEACRMLIETNLPITEIALESGFPNLSNFNRRFRELKDTSPREFRSRSKVERAQQTTPHPAARTYS
ncbi:MAG: AraC family transcriptional regulator, partial [Verrucomicrobiota bacterium]